MTQQSQKGRRCGEEMTKKGAHWEQGPGSISQPCLWVCSRTAGVPASSGRGWSRTRMEEGPNMLASVRNHSDVSQSGKERARQTSEKKFSEGKRYPHPQRTWENRAELPLLRTSSQTRSRVLSQKSWSSQSVCKSDSRGLTVTRPLGAGLLKA